MRTRRWLIAPGLIALLSSLGCEPPAGLGSGAAPGPPADVQPAARASATGTFDAGATPALQEAMQNAMAQGAATLPEAQARWAEQPPLMQQRWSIKWAWATTDGGNEYVWVNPVRWTEFRIEGWLSSAPEMEHDPSFGPGELVSFPAGQAVDWAHWPTGDLAGPFEGGYTIRVFEAYERGELGDPASPAGPE